MTVSLRQLPVAAPSAPPLTMPDQDLTAPFRDPAAPGIRTGLRTQVLRALVLIVPLLVTAGLGWISIGWFALDGRLTLAEGALVAVTVFAFYWVVQSVATSVLGLFWRAAPQAEALNGLQVAILLPMYGEHAKITVGNAVTLLQGLSGSSRHGFSLHVLSDTRDPVAALAEEAAVAALRRSHPRLALHYRHRPQNLDYKSGNIRDWVQRSGQGYDAMLVLDADSIMGPKAVIAMANAMALNAGLGLIQTVPRVLPGRTLWQGLQSFASEVYGSNLGRGFAMWAGPVANFFGHNALIRTRAFAASAGLPHLPGRAPRGGVILSHDFVEAALLRRAGWGVQVMPEAADSYEDTPATLAGYLRRDRRWCQGNMQHLRLLATRGLHPLSRFHLVQGAMAYLASVWWLALLVLWTVLGQDGVIPDFFAANPAMPVWPALPPITQATLAALVGAMLLAPKLLGIAAYLRDNRLTLTQIPAFAGMVVTEITLSVLLAPMLMVHQVRAVLRTMLGFDGGWTPHQLDRPDLLTLIRFHATETVFGFSLLGLALVGHLNPWLLPVAISLSLAVPLAALLQMPMTAFQRRQVASVVI
ncbi:MAG: glucans biosynthesis glucosyltransferase MdoH [Paracoccaceae bacterium]